MKKNIETIDLKAKINDNWHQMISKSVCHYKNLNLVEGFSRSLVLSHFQQALSSGSYTARSVVAERSSALDASSGVVRMWVRIPAWPVAALVLQSYCTAVMA